MRRPVILNSKGQPIVLTAPEQAHADWAQRELNARHSNSLGFEIDITTLTTLVKSVTEQKFFETPPAKFVPIRVGQGAYGSNLTTYRSFDAAGEFEEGIIDMGGNNTRLASADAAVDSLNIKIFDWAKSVGWTLVELRKAMKSGNWDLITAKEESRKKNWDLGIQRIAFLGARGLNGSNGSCVGLMNQPGVNVDTTTIPQPIKNMDPTELKAFVAAVIEAYRDNCDRTAWPTHFQVPESDFNGLISQSSPAFPMKSTLELLLEAFRLGTQNEQFQILPLAYGDAKYHADVTAIVGKQVYSLYRYDEKSLRMDVPVDYTNTLANSIDNFSFQNAAYGEFTGVLAYRPLEFLYFQH